MDKIKASFIFEMMGRPPEHIKATLEGYIDKLGSQEGIEITKKNIHEAKLIEDKEEKKEGNEKKDDKSEDNQEKNVEKKEGDEEKDDKSEDNQEKNVEKKEFYTTFAEVELIADNLNLIFLISTNMLPSNVEILEPENIRLTNFDLSAVLSELSVKLHRYDEVAKVIAIQNKNLKKQIKEFESEKK